MSGSQAPRTYAVCVYCKLRRVDRSLFYVDPYFPAAGVNYRCTDLDACGERRRAREVAAAERRQAKREAAELAKAERQEEAIAALAETEARLSAEVAEYVAIVDHLCTPVADGGHGLVRESVKIVAYDTPQARSLHRMQQWRGECAGVQLGAAKVSTPTARPDDRCSTCHRDAHRPGTGWQGHHYTAPEAGQPEQCDAETPTRYCVLDMGHDGQHIDGIATWTSR